MTAQDLKDWARYVTSPFSILAFFAGGILCTITGPFGTYLTMGWAERAVYWFTLVGVSLVLSLTIRRFVDLRWAAYGFWARAWATTFAFSVPFTGFVALMNSGVFGISHHGGLPVWQIFLVVNAVPMMVNPLIYLVLRMTGELPGESQTKPAPRLARRLSESLGTEVIRVSVEDHYVSVTTPMGTERLRMRFSDALDELDKAEGMQVHRSHWVATSAVEAARIEGKRVLLRLSDGSEIPVSRGFRSEVEAAGLLSEPIRQGKAPHAVEQA